MHSYHKKEDEIAVLRERLVIAASSTKPHADLGMEPPAFAGASVSAFHSPTLTAVRPKRTALLTETSVSPGEGDSFSFPSPVIQWPEGCVIPVITL